MRREFSSIRSSGVFNFPIQLTRRILKPVMNPGILSIQLPKKEEVVQKTPKQIEIK